MDENYRSGSGSAPSRCGNSRRHDVGIYAGSQIDPADVGRKEKTEYHLALELIEYLIDHHQSEHLLFETLAAKIKTVRRSLSY